MISAPEATNQEIKPVSTILNFVALDIETTGLDSSRDEIIQIAAIRFVNGEQTEIFNKFIKPRKDVPKYIQHLTHISSADLLSAPPIGLVLPDLVKFIGDSIIVGHNVAFDLGFIDENLIRTGKFPLANKRWDTAEIGRIYLPFTNDHKLSTLVREFDIMLENAHRADADAIATGELLVKLTEYVVSHYPLLLNARLLDLSKQAKLEKSVYHYLYSLVEYQRHYALLGPKPAPPKNDLVNVIEHNIPGAGVSDLESVFDEGGFFAKKFDNYEFRSGQLEMAKQVSLAFAEEKHLAVEAGTGVGKSFAYLIPAMQFALQKKTKVLISTNTKNLQEQLFFKDLPQLRKILPIPFKACLVKGRDNYICERRWDEFLGEQSKGYTEYEAHAMLYLVVWKQLTHTGDISENSSFDKNRFSFVWRKVCSDRYLCSNRKCPFNKHCYVMGLRRDIENASIVVANHSLLLADRQAENTTLGEYSYLIIDEAHNLMASASRHLGFEFAYADINNLLYQLGSSAKRRHSGFLQQLDTTISKSLVQQSQKDHVNNLCKSLEKALEEIKNPLTSVFNEAGNMVQQTDSFGKLRIKEISQFPGIHNSLKNIAISWKELMKQLTALSNVLSSFNSKLVPQYEMLSETITAYIQRMAEIEGMILVLISPDLENYALWLETNPKPDRNTPASTICYAPIEVGGHLNRLLYEQIPSIVFTSATLALRGSFKFFYGQSGLQLMDEDRIRQVIVDSPFDYDKQSKLLLASFLPEPKDKFFNNQALSCLEQIVSTTSVGTMVLFTSYKDLNSVFDHLTDTLYHRNRPFFAQGKGGSRSSILNEFKQMDNAVLLGTNSFWEGVDVQGKSLSLLILYKLPFMVPSEPIVEAYIDKLERENKDSFMHYMLPTALLKLRQGFGRLIRSKADSGIVLIMDSRVSRKQYGDYFKKVLPCISMEMRDENELVSSIASFFNKI